MAGTIVGVSGCQQNDVNGAPLAGCIVSVFAGGTTTLVEVFQDAGLTVPGSNPMFGDDSGRVPFFYVADGTYKVRLTDADGVMTNGGFETTLLAIGPSTGGGGGGGAVIDPTTIFQTGDSVWIRNSGTRTGWVRENGRTIGSALSGATERANADTQALFIFLWTTFSNAKCPVSGGRGATALADFNANKTITLFDMRGKAPFGLDGMGNTRANIIADSLITSGGGDTADTAGASGGEDEHTLIDAETPIQTHPVTVTDPGHTVLASTAGAAAGGAFAAVIGGGGATAALTNPQLTGISATVPDHGGGGAHNNMSPFILGTFYQKL